MGQILVVHADPVVGGHRVDAGCRVCLRCRAGDGDRVRQGAEKERAASAQRAQHGAMARGEVDVLRGCRQRQVGCLGQVQ